MDFTADQGRARYVGHKASNYLFKSISPKNGRKLNYSIYAHFCSDTETVKLHLDSGVLAEMLAKKETVMLTKKSSATIYAGPGYEFVLLGACAMSLGCVIPEHYMARMRDVYTYAGLMRDGVMQMNEALDGPRAYEDCKPYDFGIASLDLNSTLLLAKYSAKKDNPAASDLVSINTDPQGKGSPFNGSTERLDAAKAGFVESKHAVNECSGCGATAGKNGAALLDCSGCHKRKYCSKECQKQHWKAAHKKFCKWYGIVDKGNTKPSVSMINWP
jgi:hypothetical protein